jgi:hypothetical protein
MKEAGTRILNNSLNGIPANASINGGGAPPVNDGTEDYWNKIIMHNVD